MGLREDIAGREVSIAFPAHLIGDIAPLLHAESAEFEAVFGAPVRFTTRPPGSGPRWLVHEDQTLDVNSLQWRRESLTLISSVRDGPGLIATVQLLHSLVAHGVSQVSDVPSERHEERMAWICREVAMTFPGFGIRNLDWRELRSRFPADDDLTAHDLSRMLALLGDVHTGVRSSGGVYHPPYAVMLVGDEAVLRRVPPGSAAAHAGVGPGWRLEIDDTASIIETTGAPAHSLALMAGRRAIRMDAGEEREFAAVSAAGERRTWLEQAETWTADRLIEITRLSRTWTYLRLQNWFDGCGLDDRLDEVLGATSPPNLVIDLRGNTGGSLAMAQRWRRRFLRELTWLGSVQFTRGDRTLADPVQLWDEPVGGTPWPGHLVVLTDGLTCSASEDFLHGLQGLAHVTVIGGPTCGGSGRPRTLHLTDDVLVTISTALTFDRAGRCIEGAGIEPDIGSDPFSDAWRNHLPSLE